MPTVAELTELTGLYGNFMIGPRPGRDVCRRCFNLTDGFYVRTDGADPEFSISNLRLTGQLDGEGQFGFLGAKLENAGVTVNGVSVAIDLVAPSGNSIGISDLFHPDIVTRPARRRDPCLCVFA